MDKASFKNEKSFQDQVQVTKGQVREKQVIESYNKKRKKTVTREEDRHKILIRQKRQKVQISIYTETART